MKYPILDQASALVIDPYHSPPSSFHCPTHIYLLCFPYPAMGRQLEIKYVLLDSNMPISPTAKIGWFGRVLLAYT